MSSLYKVLLPVFAFLLVSPAMADNYKEALDLIASTAERICQTVPMKSSSNELELSGQAKADVNGLVSRIAGLGIGGAAKYKNEETEGVLQKDLAPLLSKTADCKEREFNKLVDLLIKPTVVPAPTSAPAHDPDTIYQNGIAVGHVTGAEPHPNQSAILFSKITDTGNLDRNRDFQYRKWILHLAQIQSSIGINVGADGAENAVIEGVTCKIVGSATSPNVP